MNRNTIKLLLQHPTSICSSMLSSIIFCKSMKLKLFTTPKTKISIKKSSKFNVDKKAFIGIYTTRIGEIYNPKYEYTYIKLTKNSELLLQDKVFIGAGSKILIGVNAKVEIGSGTEITGGCKIFACESIKIGRNCMIAWDVQIMDTDWHVTKSNKGECTKKVIIEDNVWIAAGVKVMKGVTIKKGSVIASGTIVTSDVPENTLFGGIPGKILKKDFYWEQ